ncbi:Crp/Fnr family transcriptional regulator [Carboxylicivirga sp. N1Y90]|uniref:Crp/Fnr family transcriptional regulator n=1 Tax=Carboxylicivirga fragile TaxID=3417571 RepID=UPI003D328C21|nr:Crp/Fnr family transcriptional regulator [Marinilabiliaceae bacterium N1Y90]
MVSFNYTSFFEAQNKLSDLTFKKCRKYEFGDVVYAQDSTMKHAYYVKSGLLKIFRSGKKGDQQIVRLVKAGSLIGFHSLLSDEPEVTGCESLTESEVCVIPGDALIKAMKEDKALSEMVMKQTMEELKQTCNSLIEISQKTVRGRLANLFLKLQELFQTKDDEPIPLVISRVDMARWIGTSKESVSRLITEFKEDGVLAFNRREISIVSKEKLQKIVMIS